MSGILSYALYFVTFATSICSSMVYEKKDTSRMPFRRKLLYFLAIASPVILLQGLRYDVGTDYFSYAGLSEGLAKGNREYISWYLSEPLFMIYSILSYNIGGGNKYFFFMADAVLMNALLFSIFNQIKEYESSISMPAMYFIYYSICFPYFLNAERQGIAVLIVWFAMRYMVDRKPLKFMLCIIVAVMFHNTAIIGLMLYPAYIIFKDKKWIGVSYLIIVVSLLMPVLFGLSINLLSKYVPVFHKYAKFINETGDTRVNVNWLFALAMVFVVCLFINIVRKSRLDYRFLFFMLSWMLSCFLLNYYIEYGFRMSYYFEVALIYGLATIIGKIRRNENKVILNALLICSMLFYFTYKFYVQGNSEIFPYKSILTAMEP